MASNTGEFLDLINTLARQTNEPYFLLQGKEQTGKTSILFQQAILATLEGTEVLFICPAPPVKLPALPPGSSSQLEHLKQIQLRYPATPADLIQLLAGVHENSLRPGLVLLDCLESYVKADGEEFNLSSAACILALLRDAAHFWDTQTGRNYKIPVIASTKLHHHVMLKWLPHCIKIEREGALSFNLQADSPVPVSCRYALENGQFLRSGDVAEINED